MCRYSSSIQVARRDPGGSNVNPGCKGAVCRGEIAHGGAGGRSRKRRFKGSVSNGELAGSKAGVSSWRWDL